MTDRSDDKIELLVRSVLAAVDARLAEVRTEIQSVVADADRRHRDVLAQIQALEHRMSNGVDSAGSGDSLAAQMEHVTQVMLERVEALHQRNTLATNERFALMNNALEQLNSGTIAAPFTSVAPVPMASLDAMNAPLRVGPPPGQVPVAATMSIQAVKPETTEPKLTEPELPEPEMVEPEPEMAEPMVTAASSVITLPPIPPLTSAPPSEPTYHESEPIDMSRLADLLSERLGSLNLPAH